MLQDVVGVQNLTNIKEKSFRGSGGIEKKDTRTKLRS